MLKPIYFVIIFAAFLLVGAVLVAVGEKKKRELDIPDEPLEVEPEEEESLTFQFKQDDLQPLPDDEQFEQQPIEEVSAYVYSKQCELKTFGTHIPETKPFFKITFSTVNGEMLPVYVDEERYLSVEENQSVTLAMMNGKFFDFCV